MNYKVWITINGVHYVPFFDEKFGWIVEPAIEEKFADNCLIDASDISAILLAVEEDFSPDEYTVEIFSYKGEFNE